MKKLARKDSKAAAVKALISLYQTVYQSADIYVIKRELGGDTPDITLWMSGWDYQRLIIVANGSGVSVLEVEANTRRYRNNSDLPKGTEDYKYIVVG